MKAVEIKDIEESKHESVSLKTKELDVNQSKDASAKKKKK